MQGRSGMSKMRVAFAIVSAVTFTARLAAADDAPAWKDRDAAFKLSAGATVVSIGMVVAGASTGHNTLTDAGLLSSLVTPSAGELYAGKLLTPGMGIRALAAGLELAAFSEAHRCGYYVLVWSTDSCHNSSDLTKTLLVVGALGYVTGTVYDIATASHAADDYNQRLQLRVTPTIIPTAASGPAVGLGLGGSF
jgi:hypothetical protein